MEKSTYKVIIIILAFGLVASYFIYQNRVDLLSNTFNQDLQNAETTIINRYYNDSIGANMGFIDGYADGLNDIYYWGINFTGGESYSNGWNNGYSFGSAIGLDMMADLDNYTGLDYIAGYAVGFSQGGYDGLRSVPLGETFCSGFRNGFISGFNYAMELSLG